ncbi:hypothetical protein BASA50_002754 [Batrachochytrium salamandrivorans]|uniref:NUC153 domain-containing protein n=1 Tax=Batrachochytrium salamandrivorans TaxID=1357716 RepID=A0ABQ8FKD4_9FUNG|nr:hypothetical protein BASA50_002754 [Batrachochytrium salamandrivorans]
MAKDKIRLLQHSAGKPVRPTGTVADKPVVSDPRFSRVHSDPRFIKPKKDATKITIDHRFSGMLSSKDFGSTGKGPKVDKYGRKKTTTHSKELQQFYKLDSADTEPSIKSNEPTVHSPSSDTSDTDGDSHSDLGVENNEDDSTGSVDDEEADSSAIESDEAVAKIDTVQEFSDSSDSDQDGDIQGYDLARGEGLADSSEDEDDDGSTMLRRHPNQQGQSSEDTIDIGPYAEETIPIGDETHRFAVVNMDWDHVKAKDLFKIFDGFKPKTGTICSVKIYPSEFGKERIEQELQHGPPSTIFLTDDSNTDDLLIKADDGKEFNNNQLRKYQIERLRYYYAVVECDSVTTARALFEACDGTEYESSANFFDLRYVPNSMTFDDPPAFVAHAAPSVYEPVEFVTQALQHSNVKLTWDTEDTERIRVTRRKFTKDDLKDMDFKAYIASSSDDEDDLGDGEDADALRAKYQALLKGDSMNDAFGRKDHDEDEGQEMEITFASGLSEKAAGRLERKKEEDSHKDETVFESYLRKRKEKRKAKKGANATKVASEDDTSSDEDGLAGHQDDPFFQEDFGPEFEKQSGKSKSNSAKGDLKSGVNSDKKSRKEAAAEEAKSKAELELLLLDENQSQSRHFDMKAVIRDDVKGKRKQHGKKKAHSKDMGEVQEDFKIDIADPRFSAVIESHQYAIDPTNPQFKKTKGMGAMLSARRKVLEQSEGSNPGKSIADVITKTNGSTKVTAAPGKTDKTELTQLVDAVKRKSALATQGGQGKRRRK